MRANLLATPVAVSLLVLVSCFSTDVLGRPGPDPKSEWVRNARSRKGLNKNLKRWDNETTSTISYTPTATPACANAYASEIAAPNENVWGGLTDSEAASVVQWLFAQPELNLTVTANATEWDNTVYFGLLLCTFSAKFS